MQSLAIHRCFEKQVEETPNVIAVRVGEKCLTYRELNQQSNQLAHHLRQLGVKPETSVGLYMDASLKLVVAVFGILKSGGVYVPILPSFPLERTQFILKDAQAFCLLTQEKYLPNLQSIAIQTIALDKDWLLLAQHSLENPNSSVSLQNAAYILYTSGSTGVPKGVLVEHQSLAYYVSWSCNVLRKTTNADLPLTSALSFAASITQLFSSLLLGRTLHILSSELVPRPDLLLNWFEIHEGFGLYCVPTLWEEIIFFAEVRQKREGTPKGPECVYLSGEAIPQDLVARSFAIWPQIKIWNLYGPTEATANVSMDELSPCYPVSLGSPIPGTRMYLLGEDLNPVPIGTLGQLYVSGDGLARGYINRSDLTADRFIPNPFSEKPGSRLYKTGDLARYRNDGSLEFLGRHDNQVQIRGFRVELEEIETVLRKHSAILKAIVAVKDVRGGKHLVAYVVYQQSPYPTLKEIRTYLLKHLPGYMIPSVFVQMEDIPLLPNGKVKRNGLPAQSQIQPWLGYAYVAPQTQMQTLLEQIWTEVLGLERIGIHDNFFELGAHSLQIGRVIAKIQQHLCREVSLRSIFESPTIEALAESFGRSDRDNFNPTLFPLQLPLQLVSRPSEIPLSYQQQRLWFLSQLLPDMAAYNIRFEIRLNGRLDLPVLQWSLNQIVQQQEALRTTLQLNKGKPVQAISTSLELDMPCIDLQSVPENQREENIQRIARDEANIPFDLATEPLIRVKLLKFDERQHTLLVVVHHVVFDGWSINVFVKELGICYEAKIAGCSDSLPPLPIQYADFSIQQQNYLQGDVLTSLLEFWKDALAGCDGILELPYDRPRPSVQSYKGATKSIVLPSALSIKICSLSQQENVTPFMVFLTAFKILLYRYSGQSDILVGCPVANRTHLAVEGLIGFFTNTLVLRSKISDEMSFWEFLLHVREMFLRFHDHQLLPFEKLVDELQLKRSLSHNPLFQIMFAFQEPSLPVQVLQELSMEVYELEHDTSKFDLTLEVQESGTGLEVRLNYNVDLFNSATIERMLTHYQRLLEGIVANPQLSISSYPLLSEREQEQIVIQWNDTARDYPRDKCLHQLFEEQVIRSPNAVGLMYGSEPLTYKELNNQANQLAHYLKKRGVGVEVPIGLFMERSIEMVVGLLGILKSGGAYVPLDPSYPKERLAFMIEDAGMPIVLAQHKLKDSLPPYSGKLVYLDTEWHHIAQESTQNPDSLDNSECLAYIIYTSGSTGKPKGAMLTHRGICNRLMWMQSVFQLSDNDRVLHKTSINFDVSVWELFWPLLTGACLVLANSGGHKDPEYLVKVIAEQKITTIHFVPSMLKVFLNERLLETCSCLKRIICSGEELTYELEQRVFERLNVELHNLYGPTEASIDVSHWTCQTKNNRCAVPIGHPIFNTELYILDSQLRPLPVGIPGELYIGGEGLARGYLAHPALTAETFIPNAFSQKPGARLYRTGDKSRFRSDGAIEFLGRIDHQVKVRGYRVELGELEHSLTEHPHVSEAVVMLREDIPGNMSLVAYVSCTGTIPSSDELRTFLKRKLPDYMIPSAYVVLHSIPFLPNGKIDRRALPVPKCGNSETLAPPAEFLTDRECIIAEIWKSVLHLEQISWNENFFDLGGNSLMMVQIRNSIREHLDRDVSIVDLFRYPTIETLAQHLAKLEDEVPIAALHDFANRIKKQKAAWSRKRRFPV
jgi:amino acid adenylation domain-containing protein